MEKQLTRAAMAGSAEVVFGRLEKCADDPGRRDVLVQIRQVLNAARYIQGLLRDLRAD